MPSPILPDGTLLSLPIPFDFGPTRYCDLSAPDGRTYSAILRELGWNTKRHRRGWRRGGAVCHADPDLRAEAVERHPGWQPAFGQIGIGQTQLAGHDIRPGDVFLFFGLFRLTEMYRGKLRFVPAAKPVHAVYGWLTVQAIAELTSATQRAESLRQYPWLTGHPHVEDAARWSRRITRNGPNRIYIGQSVASGPLPYASGRILTCPGLTASRWRRFPWMGRNGNAHFSRCNGAALLHEHHLDTHTGRWQELVIDSTHYPGIEPWLRQFVCA